MTRLGRHDWLDAGLGLLAAGDRRALTLERLCEQLGRTKGSFYHHFRDMPTYQLELLERWQARHTEALIDDSQVAADPRARGERLRARVAAADLRLERAIRSWAEVEPLARTAVDAVDQRRIGYLSELALARLGDPNRAKIVARIEYAAFVGSVELFADLPLAQRELLSRSLDEALAMWAERS
ncbi:TetR/AcrR family transcriptional regulator [Nannocystaceae bacterium ST9]